MKNFTRGPWKIYGGIIPFSRISIYGPDRCGFIASIASGRKCSQLADGMTSDVAVANANLISAAPDMYKVLRMFTEREELRGECRDEKCEECVIYRMAKAAIAKSEGRG